MLYEMKRIERAHPGSILPPQGLGRGRKWSVLVEVNPERHWAVKAEIDFTHPVFITVVSYVDASTRHFLGRKYTCKKFLYFVNDRNSTSDRVVVRRVTWKLPDGSLHKLLFGCSGSYGSQRVMFAVQDVIKFRVIMHAMLNVHFHLELKRLVRNFISKRLRWSIFPMTIFLTREEEETYMEEYMSRVDLETAPYTSWVWEN